MPPCMLNCGPPCCCCAYIMLCACQTGKGVSAEIGLAGHAAQLLLWLEEWWRWRTWYMAACCGLAYMACCCMAAMACI